MARHSLLTRALIYPFSISGLRGSQRVSGATDRIQWFPHGRCQGGARISEPTEGGAVQACAGHRIHLPLAAPTTPNDVNGPGIQRDHTLPVAPPGFQWDTGSPRPHGGISPVPIIKLGPINPHGVDVRTRDATEMVYTLPPGTTFRLPSWTEVKREGGSEYMTIESTAVGNTRYGATVLMPRLRKATSVRISRDPVICLPADSPEARVIYSKDREAVETWCSNCYHEIIPPEGMQRKAYSAYLDHCRGVNLWHVGGDFVRVPVGVERIPPPQAHPRATNGNRNM